MPYAFSSGVRLYYEQTGTGVPIIFVHEFSGDLRSWEVQLRYFSRRYRCIAFNARGYPPSDVPNRWSDYSQEFAVDDIASVMLHLKIRKAHIIGCSMGAFATLKFGMRFPRKALSLTTIGAGSGPDPGQRAQFLRKNRDTARLYLESGMEGALKTYHNAPNRIQLRLKDPRAYTAFCARFLQGSALGHALTLRGLQSRRTPLHQLERELRRLTVPTHVVCGDEDDNALDSALFIKRTCPAARLTVVPASGHVVNAEEPALFNRITDEFLALVDGGKWQPRDPRSLNPSTMARKP